MANKRGNYSVAEMKTMVDNSHLPAAQVALMINRSEEAVQKYDGKIFKNTSVTTYKGETKNGKSRFNLVDENIVPWNGKL